MYKINRVGPWPIIDPSQAKINVTDSVTANETLTNAQKLVRLDTANLGTKSEAFTTLLHNPSVIGLSADSCISYGVALAPLNTVCANNGSVFLDLSVVANLRTENESHIQPSVFVGFIDGVGAAIGNGWNAANLVSNPVMIPTIIHNFDSISVTTQVLLKNINSAALNYDKFVVVGVSWSNANSSPSTVDHVDLMISARYATKSVPAVWKES